LDAANDHPMSEFNKQLVFLCYLNRSGSTLLAKKLDELEEVDVGIEEDFPDGIRRGKIVNINNSTELERYLDAIEKSGKFGYWKVTRKELSDELNKHDLPIKYNQVLKSLLALYFKESSRNVIVHKKALYFLHRKKIKDLFPDAKVIFISRDPRGIYNSQQSSKGSLSGEVMQRDVVKFAAAYKYSVLRLKKWLDDPNFLMVRYEDLVQDADSEIGRISTFLEVANSRKEGDYYKKIPTTQRHLHRNLKSDLIEERTTAWKNELKSIDLEFLQKALRDYMGEMGFPIHEKELSMSNRIKSAYLVLKFRFYFLLVYFKRSLTR
jgi:hypothetical protein